MSSYTKKFQDRVIKYQKAAESCGKITPIKEDSMSKNLCDILQKWYGLGSAEIIITSLKDLRNLDTSIQVLKTNLKKYISLSQKACIIGTMLRQLPINLYDQVFDIIISLGKHLQQYPILLKRVQKLGPYYGMALRFKKLLINPNFFKLCANICFIEVSFPYFFLFRFFNLTSFINPSHTPENFCYPLEFS